MIQLDDYFKPAEMVPVFEGFENWDDPEALYLDRLAKDLEDLSKGNAIEAMTKNAFRNPDYKITQKRILSVFEPKAIMLVEGFLCLYDSKIRNYFSHSIWLEIDHEKGWGRRSHFKNDEYYEKVFKPMYAKYVAPTKRYSNFILDVSSLSQDDVSSKVLELLGIESCLMGKNGA